MRNFYCHQACGIIGWISQDTSKLYTHISSYSLIVKSHTKFKSNKLVWIPDIFLKLTSVYNHLPFSDNSFFKRQSLGLKTLETLLTSLHFSEHLIQYFKKSCYLCFQSILGTQHASQFSFHRLVNVEFLSSLMGMVAVVFWIFPLLPSLSSIVCPQYSSQRDPGDP